MEQKKIISPFEFAIMKIADPEKAINYREETYEEKSQRIENNIRDFFSKIKFKPNTK